MDNDTQQTEVAELRTRVERLEYQLLLTTRVAMHARQDGRFAMKMLGLREPEGVDLDGGTARRGHAELTVLEGAEDALTYVVDIRGQEHEWGGMAGPFAAECVCRWKVSADTADEGHTLAAGHLLEEHEAFAEWFPEVAGPLVETPAA